MATLFKVQWPNLEDLSTTDVSKKRFLHDTFKDSSSSSSMNVDGSTTPKEFTYEAESGKVKVIYMAKLIIKGSCFYLNKTDARYFSANYKSGLTNGLEMYIQYTSTDKSYIYLSNPKTAGCLSVESDDIINFPDIDQDGIDLLACTYNFQKYCDGIRLHPDNTYPKLVVNVKDNFNIDEITLMQMHVKGYYEVL